MSLPELLLDDLDWRVMVETMRNRIAAVSGEEWTLHAPVDPGVTLLELLAHQLEQRSYWLDQVPDVLINGLIALLGAKRRPARAAATVLSVESAAVSVVPADSIFRVADGGGALQFATRESLALLPVARIDLSCGFGARSVTAGADQRWAMQPLPLLPADGSEAELQITLWMSAAPQPDAAPTALLLDLGHSDSIPRDPDHPGAIRPGWAHGAAQGVPVPAQLRWSYSSAAPAGFTPFGGNSIIDGTEGLRRSGLVRLTVPGDWTPAGTAVNGLTPYRLSLHCAGSSYSAPPQLQRIVPNAVVAHHSIPISVAPEFISAQTDQWLPLPGRILNLPDRPPPLEDSIELALRGRDEGWRDWHGVQDFARSGPEDAVLYVNRPFNRIEFGDGLTGRLPVPSRLPGVPLTLTYRAGGGAAGNLGANLAWECDDPAASAVNPVPGTGGRESEAADAARNRVGAELQECHRAVTLNDYETLAIATPGVGVRRAKAVAGQHPAFPCLTVPGAVGVTIVPDVPRGDGWLHGPRRVDRPQPDPGMLAAVRSQLESARLLTAEVHVSGPSYRPIEVEVALAGSPLDLASTNARLQDRLALFLDPLMGGQDGTGWPFGHPVRPSELAHILQELVGTDATVERALVRVAGSGSEFGECADIPLGPAELVVLHSLRLRWSLPVDPKGGLS